MRRRRLCKNRKKGLKIDCITRSYSSLGKVIDYISDLYIRYILFSKANTRLASSSRDISVAFFYFFVAVRELIIYRVLGKDFEVNVPILYSVYAAILFKLPLKGR